MMSDHPLPVDIPLAVERLGLETDLIHELVLGFVREAPRRIRHMERALTRTDSASLEQAARTLMGTSANLGLHRVCLHACRLEALAREQRLDGVPHVLDALEVEVHRVNGYLADLLTDRS